MTGYISDTQEGLSQTGLRFNIVYGGLSFKFNFCIGVILFMPPRLWRDFQP